MFIIANVYNDKGQIIASVKNNFNLGNDNGTFNKMGVTRLDNNEYVLINSGILNEVTAEIIPEFKAFDLIMKYNPGLLNENKFKELRQLKENLIKETD